MSASAGTGPLLRVSSLVLARGDRRVLDGVDILVGRGEICALMGLSGSGKTTVLRCAVGLESFDGGRIEVDGFSLVPGPVPPQSRLKPLRLRAGMVFQQHALFGHLNALDNTALAPIYAHSRAPAEARERGRQLLDALGVGARASAYPRELSGGEAQRVAIARALAVDPPLLLMDDVDFASAFADRVVVLAAGRVAEQGSPADVLVHPRHPATQELLQTPPPREVPR